MPRPDPDQDRQDAYQTRLVALVIVGTMILWFGAQCLGGMMDLQPRFAFLADLAALAGFVWALIVTLRIWRRRHKN